MTALLTDIGGTHMRIARDADGVLTAPEKFAVADFPSLPAILDRYCAVHDLTPGGTVRIATAANPWPDGMWHFTNNETITLDPAAFTRAGWAVAALTDDFLASAHGIGDAATATLRAGEVRTDAPSVLLGPGTGLGLAYLVPTPGGRHVQQTFGGHMLATAATAEQRQVLDAIAALRGAAVAVPEDVASGRGLATLQGAVRDLRGESGQDMTLTQLMQSDAPVAQDTLRLFHEFLGLFAHHAILTLHAFGGLYLDGGVLQALRRHGKFDFAGFVRYLDLDVAPVVRAALAATPIHAVADPYIALRGLRG